MTARSSADQDDYRSSHVGSSFGEKYDQMYEQVSFDSEVWAKEARFLTEAVERHRMKRRLLDFACGTGRILGSLESRFDEALGVDISPDMLAQARTKIKKAKLVHADVTQKPEAVPGQFDCITSFRFFLNAQPALREEAMAFLSKKLDGPEARLIFNIHGNRFSARGIEVLFDILLRRDKEHSLMSVGQVKRLLKRHDLELIEYHGMGWLSNSFYRRMPRGLWHWGERVLGSSRWFRNLSTDLIFVARKRQVDG